jgi:hypothetical protein
MPFAERSDSARSPRQQRETARVHRAAAAARAAGASAMAAALAEIGAAFDETAVINDFKLRIEWLMRLPPDHPALPSRFGARAALLPERDLDAAIRIVERWWREERKAFQIGSALGCGTRLSLEVLRELRLILRLTRFKGMRMEYEAALAALCETSIAMAAE